MSCTSDIISLAFSFHTPTFFAKVRISWNSWPLFSCWLRLCDVRFRLGSRVCVFVCLFCSLVVVSFVVGWQQHCRYIVIDAMVYPKNWILEDEFGTGKTSGVFGLNLVFLHLVLRQRRFWIQKLRHCAWIDRDEFWMMLHHLLCVLEDVFFFDYLLIMNVIWNHEHFSTDMIQWSVHGSDVIGWDVMSKGGMEIWRPMGTPFV